MITGGAGFIGCNLSQRLLERGEEVVVFDDLSRPGSSRNLAWLQSLPAAHQLRFVQGDIRDSGAVVEAAQGAVRVYHLASQVAVTTSVLDPRLDFETNALGTFNALEAARQSGTVEAFLYSSTNKVYGGLEELRIEELATRYALADLPLGISEQQQLDFHSPYGCSKGAGDQYVRDYHRIYSLPTVVLRQSCIYGQRQMGMEDQGWLAWFVIAAQRDDPITIYGDGKQIRDVLHVDDLLDAYDAAVDDIERAAGEVFNVGGGVGSSLSVWQEFGPMLEELLGRPIGVRSAGWRPGDQKIYVSDIRKAETLLGWRPRISLEVGLQRLVDWVRGNAELFAGS